MEIIVVSEREGVFRAVARRMEWEGTRGPLEEDSYGRVSVSEADRGLLHSFFDEAAMRVIDVCRPFLRGASNDDVALRLRMECSALIDGGELQLAIDNMLAADVLAQWQGIVSPAGSGSSGRKRDECGLMVQSVLYHHQRPVRRRAGD